MNNKLTNQQAFNAMRDFLEKHYERTSSDDIGSLLGDLQLLHDGGTAVPAAWQAWLESVEAVIKGTANSGMINLYK